VAVTGEQEDDREIRRNERPSTGYYPFGIIQRELQDLREEFDEICVGEFGCIDGPGRQIVIWYGGEGALQDQAMIQTVYYHVSVDELLQYQQLREICSASRNTTWNRVVENHPDYDVCRVEAHDFLGQALKIGFADAPHLHYEVYIDRDNNGQFIRGDGNAGDREDPLMAFSTIR
jgi:hypothetical protein